MMLDANSLFSVFDHRISVAQLVVGVLGLGTVIIVAKHRQRAGSSTPSWRLLRTIFPRSIIMCCPEAIWSWEPTRNPYTSSTCATLLSLWKWLVPIGRARPYSSPILSLMTCWYRYVFSARGLFLAGSQRFPTVTYWLKDQISTSEKNYPFASLADLLSQRRREQQCVRLFLHMSLKDSLPRLLSPQLR
jgi:hypothetical protein